MWASWFTRSHSLGVPGFIIWGCGTAGAHWKYWNKPWIKTCLGESRGFVDAKLVQDLFTFCRFASQVNVSESDTFSTSWSPHGFRRLTKWSCWAAELLVPLTGGFTSTFVIGNVWPASRLWMMVEIGIYVYWVIFAYWGTFTWFHAWKQTHSACSHQSTGLFTIITVILWLLVGEVSNMYSPRSTFWSGWRAEWDIFRVAGWGQEICQCFIFSHINTFSSDKLGWLSDISTCDVFRLQFQCLINGVEGLCFLFFASQSCLERSHFCHLTQDAQQRAFCASCTALKGAASIGQGLPMFGRPSVVIGF